ncbi:MAG: putative toxin-antitoxin system toxin component, PIN family [Chitinispirillia bacterium]|nr:putative toxin-antitoxin system toxin component, PIN family [Chitinispirillia bacterium]
MQKIVVDTNVFVSALIQNSFPRKIVYDLLLEKKVVLCLSLPLLYEYIEVLCREKFCKYRDFFLRAESIISFVKKEALMYSPKIKLDVISDKDDNKILELADESNADFIVTGNTNDFTLPQYKNTKILIPRDYWLLFHER